MRYRPARRDRRAAELQLRRRGLRVERLEPRSMLAADVDVADGGVPGDSVSGAGVPGAGDDFAAEVSAVACEFITCEFPIAAEPCVLIEPECTVDARITTDPPELWVPISFDPEAFEAGGATEAVDGQSADLQEPEAVPGDSEAAVSGDGDPVAEESGAPADPSTDEHDASAAVNGEPEDAEATDATEESLPEGVSLMICPRIYLGMIDPPVFLAENPNLGDSADAVDAAIDVTGTIDAIPSDVEITERAVIEPRFRVIDHGVSPVLFFCRGGIAMPDAGPAEAPFVAAAAGADDSVAEPVSEPVVTTESAGDAPVAMIAMASSTNSASLTTLPAVTTGASDAARLFAAYAAGLGQGGADPQSSTTIGGRRSGRRAN